MVCLFNNDEEARKRPIMVVTKTLVIVRIRNADDETLKDADKIKFVEDIQRSETDYKQLCEKYSKFFRN